MRLVHSDKTQKCLLNNLFIIQRVFFKSFYNFPCSDNNLFHFKENDKSSFCSAVLVKIKVAQIKPAGKFKQAFLVTIIIYSIRVFTSGSVLKRQRTEVGVWGRRGGCRALRGRRSAEERKDAEFPLNLFNKKYIHHLIYSFSFTRKHKSFK